MYAPQEVVYDNNHHIYRLIVLQYIAIKQITNLYNKKSVLQLLRISGNRSSILPTASFKPLIYIVFTFNGQLS